MQCCKAKSKNLAHILGYQTGAVTVGYGEQVWVCFYSQSVELEAVAGSDGAGQELTGG